jgi:chitinase
MAEEWQATAAQSESGALRVSADATRVNIGAVLPLRAEGPAARNAVVDWVVEEGPSGGSVSGSGVYTAPQSPGVYHLIASTGAERARLAIKVFTVQ